MTSSRALPLLLLSACHSGAPAYTINVPPRIVDVRPQRSVAFAETEVRLEALQAALELAVPAALSGGGLLPLGGAQVGARWQLRRQPGVLSATPGGLQLVVALSGQVAVGAGIFGCSGNGPVGALVLRARPALNTAGELVLEDTQVSAQPQMDLRCAGVPVPAAPLLQQALEPLGRALAAGVHLLRLPLGPALRLGLNELARPRELPLLGQRACLDLAPQALVVAPTGGAGGVLQIRVGADVAPRLSLGPCPAGSAPPLSQVVVREQALGESYQVLVAVAIPHDDLTARLTPALVGRRLGQGSTSLTVNKVAMGDASGRALVKLDVTGVLDGSLFLWGTPQVTPRGGRQVLSVPDLRVAAETESFLQQVKLAAFQLWDNGGLEAHLRETLTLDVTDRLEQARAALSGRWTVSGNSWVPGGGGLTLTSTLGTVRPVEVESRPGVLVVHTLLSGRAELSL